MIKLNNSKMIFTSIILNSWGTSQNAVDESHQIVLASGANATKKDFSNGQHFVQIFENTGIF